MLKGTKRVLQLQIRDLINFQRQQLQICLDICDLPLLKNFRVTGDDAFQTVEPKVGISANGQIREQINWELTLRSKFKIARAW